MVSIDPRDRLKVMYELARVVLIADSLAEVARQALAGAERLIPAWRFSVGLIDHDAGMFRVYVAQGEGQPHWESGIAVPIEKFGADHDKLSRGEIDLTQDLSVSPDRRGRLEGTPLRGQMITPIMVDDSLVATLNIGADVVDFFTEEHLSIAGELADLLAAAIHQVGLRQEVRDARDAAEQVAAQLERKAKALEDRNEALDAFAHMVAHDLKGSLAGVTGVLDALTDEVTEPQWLSDLQRARGMAGVIEDTIDSLLLLASATQREVEFEVVDMGSVVEQVLTDLTGQIEAAGCAVNKPEEWPPAVAYAPWVRRIWTNYVSNAIKYGGRPPELTLGVDVEHEALRFWVRDNGRCLSPEEHGKLFRPFVRLHKKRAHGHGLGLSIVRRVAARMGGDVRSRGLAGGGNEFSFTLPSPARSDAE